MRNHLPRRAALLGAAGLLAGCDTLDGLLGTRKERLPGERRSVLRSDPALVVDPGQDGRVVDLPAPTMLSEWPMAGGPSNHAPGHLTWSERPTQVWRASIGSGSGYRQRLTAGPIIADGTVFTVDAFGQVSAFALSNGARRWSADTSRENESAGALGGGAAYANGVLYVVTGLAEVLALSAENGAIRWRAPLGSPARGAPSVAGGRIFVATTQNHLLALSAEDGRRLWIHRAQTISTLALGLPAPAVEGESVVAGFGTGELTALRAADGRQIWAETLGGAGTIFLADIASITGLPVIDRGRVFATGLANTTIAVDLRSGRRLWERAFGGENGVASAGDWIFAVTRGGDAVAMGRDDGRIRWITELDPTPASGRRGEAVRFGPPMVAGGRVVVPSSRGELLLLNPADGAIGGRVSLSDGVTLPAAAAEDTLVFLGDGGTLMAVR